MPVRDAPAVLAGLSALLVAGIGVLVYRASAGHIRSQAIRALLGASVVLVPVAQDEVLNNVANLHWYFMFASAWVLLWKAEANWELALGSILVFLTALSDPITAVLLPLAAVRLLGIRGWRNQLFTLALVAGVALQLGAVVVSHAHRTGLSPLFNAPKLIGWYGFFVVARAVGGMRALDELGSRGAQLLAALAGGIAVCVAVVAVRARRRLRPVVLVLLVSSALFYFVPVVPTGATPSRYTVAPVLLLFSAAACVPTVWPVGPGAPGFASPAWPSSCSWSWSGDRTSESPMLAARADPGARRWRRRGRHAMAVVPGTRPSRSRRRAGTSPSRAGGEQLGSG